MKKNVFPWTDCLTQLGFDKVRSYFQSRETVSLELVHRKHGTVSVDGEIVVLHELSENAYYFWFMGVYQAKPFGLKIKQHVIDSASRYLEEISLEAIRILEQKR
jgi:hypothetical protein